MDTSVASESRLYIAELSAGDDCDGLDDPLAGDHQHPGRHLDADAEAQHGAATASASSRMGSTPTSIQERSPMLTSMNRLNTTFTATCRS